MTNRIEKTFRKGTVIIKEGQPGSTFYVILEGMVEVLKRRGQQDAVVTVLGPNEFFGEMSLLYPESPKRTATIRALEDTRVAIMSREDFEQYLGQMSPGVRNLLCRLVDRLRKTSEKIESYKLKKDETTDKETLDFDITLDELEQAREHSVDIHFLKKKFRAGQIILHEGESGQCGFIIKKGRLEVSRTVKGRKILLSELKDNDIVGESALFDDIKRTATVTAITDGELMVFGKRDMFNMARKSPLELFFVVDSMSKKLDRTNKDYCNALIELDSLKAQLAESSEKQKELNRLLLEAREENERLKERLAKGLNTDSQPQAR
ncbi:MAG TPA: cyclic nucleotide-binding domain-containing protein [archaeon]|nr:cyclic nucleotide-binding domain-containing protein [archaeon]